MTLARIHSSGLSEGGSLVLQGVLTILLSVDYWISSLSFSSQVIQLHNHLLKAIRTVVGLNSQKGIDCLTVVEYPFPSWIGKFSSDSGYFY